MSLEWTNSPYNCDIVSYRIITATPQSNSFEDLPNPQATDYLVEGLSPDTAYFFSISGLVYGDNETVLNSAVQLDTLPIPSECLWLK